MFLPLLARDEIGAIITLIVLLVSFIGWIFNAVAGKNKPEQPPLGRPRPRKQDLRDDIFIEEEPPGRKKQQQKPKKGKTLTLAEAEAIKAAQQKKPGGEIAGRHLQTSDLGAGVRSHVSEIQQHKVDRAVEQDMQRRVDQSVAEHLGAFTAAAATAASQQNQVARDIVQALRNPASVRQALIVNSVLSPPLGRRKKA